VRQVITVSSDYIMNSIYLLIDLADLTSQYLVSFDDFMLAFAGHLSDRLLLSIFINQGYLLILQFFEPLLNNLIDLLLFDDHLPLLELDSLALSLELVNALCQNIIGLEQLVPSVTE
jgi:hypothetical protein